MSTRAVRLGKTTERPSTDQQRGVSLSTRALQNLEVEEANSNNSKLAKGLEYMAKRYRKVTVFRNHMKKVFQEQRSARLCPML